MFQTKDMADISSAIKKKNISENIKNLKDAVNGLSEADRAIIYSIIWCNSTKSNKDKYTLTDLLDVASDIKKFLKK